MSFPITSYTLPRRPTEDALAARHARVIRMMTDALAESRRLGHSPAKAVRELEGFGSMAYCTRCFLYVCVDLDESKEPNGSAYTQPCTRDRKGKRL